MFEPEDGKVGLLINILKVILFIITNPKLKIKILCSFASTNGYILSYIPFVDYTLLIHGSDVLLKDDKVYKRSLRAIKYSKSYYVSSARHFLGKRFGFLNLDHQKFEWGLSQSDMEQIYSYAVLDSMGDSNINVAGVRHVREHYCLAETLEVFISVNEALPKVSISHFAGVYDEVELKKYRSDIDKSGLSVDIIENLPRDKFLMELRSVHIGVSLTKSDLFGGPIVELIAMGAFVVVDDEHPMLEVKAKYNIDSIIAVSELSSVLLSLDFSRNAIEMRKKNARLFIESLCFENSMKEIANELL